MHWEKMSLFQRGYTYMKRYQFAHYDVDSVELKCMVVSQGVKIDQEVYKKLKSTFRIYPNALTCNCFKLPDETIVMATDLSFHLETLSSMFSWDNLKLFKYMSDMKTDFRISLVDGMPVLRYQGHEVCPIQFMKGTDFYKQKTSSGMPFVGNSVLQGCDWVAFQCLWPGKRLFQLYYRLGILGNVEGRSHLACRTGHYSQRFRLDAFWQACHGFHERAGRRLFQRGEGDAGRTLCKI